MSSAEPETALPTFTLAACRVRALLRAQSDGHSVRGPEGVEMRAVDRWSTRSVAAICSVFGCWASEPLALFGGAPSCESGREAGPPHDGN